MSSDSRTKRRSSLEVLPPPPSSESGGSRLEKEYERRLGFGEGPSVDVVVKNGDILAQIKIEGGGLSEFVATQQAT